MEAKSRDLSCGVTEGVREWTCSEDFKICKTDFLCQIAMHVQNGNLSWQNGSAVHNQKNMSPKLIAEDCPVMS